MPFVVVERCKHHTKRRDFHLERAVRHHLAVDAQVVSVRRHVRRHTERLDLEVVHAGVLDVLAERLRRTAAQTPLPERSRALVELYAPHAVDIDEDLSTHSRDWPLHRMPAVDRAILRLGAAEVLHGEETGARGAIIGEYTKIAEVLSTDDSPRFVNGLLQRLVDVRGLLG